MNLFYHRIHLPWGEHQSEFQGMLSYLKSFFSMFRTFSFNWLLFLFIMNKHADAQQQILEGVVATPQTAYILPFGENSPKWQTLFRVIDAFTTPRSGINTTPLHYYSIFKVEQCGKTTSYSPCFKYKTINKKKKAITAFWSKE